MISILLTTRCNMRCRYCLSTAAALPHRDIDIEFVGAGLADHFRETRNHAVRFYGVGEPTQRMDLLKAAHARALDLASPSVVSFELQTNGLIEDQDDVEWIGTNIGTVWVSFDGTPDLHDRHRPDKLGNPTSRRILGVIDYLGGRAFVGMRATITRAAMGRQHEIVRFAAQNGISAVFVKPVVPAVGADVVDPSLRVSPIEFAHEFVEARTVAERIGVFYGTILTVNFDEPCSVSCRACLPCPHLTPDGWVSACDRAALGTTPLVKLIYGKYLSEEKRIEYFPERIALLRGRTPANLEVCASCDIAPNCAGGCLGTAYQLTGDYYDVPRDMCEAIRFLASELPRNSGLYPYLHP